MCFSVGVYLYCMNTTEYAHLYVYPEGMCVWLCVYECVLTARQTVLRLYRRSRASWGLARYWGSSACSNRMENGTMEPGQEERKEKGRKGVGKNGREMCEGKGKTRHRVGWGHRRERREKIKRESRERHRVRDENINPSTHTQTAHSPRGRNLQMALSYVWLLIKPSHLSLSVLHSSITHLSASSLCLSASTSFTRSLSHSHTYRHTYPWGRAYIQVSPRALIRVSLILSSDLKLS